MPDSNHIFEAGARTVTSTSAANFSILERLVRSLIAEKLLDPSVCAAAGLFLSTRTSLSGRVRLSKPIYVQTEGSTGSTGNRQIFHPLDLLDELQKRGLLRENAGTSWSRVREEIGNSTDSLTQALDAERIRAENMRSRFRGFNAKRPFSSLVQALDDAGYGKHALVGFEQLVVDGHPLTPAAKVRTGMTSVDAARYGPEFGAQFGLRFVAVLRNLVEVEDGTASVVGTKVNPAQETGLDTYQHVLNEFCKDITKSAHAELLKLGKQPTDFVLIPVHPHQLDNAVPRLHADALAKQAVIPLVVSMPARPLMSYRTLAIRGNGATKGLHIKTALEVQLTGAIRGVSSTSARNGPRMSRLLARIIAGDMDLQKTDASGRVIFMPECALAGISFKESRRSLAAILREDIENGMAENEIALPISALFARSPLTNNLVLSDLIAEMSVDPAAWLRAHAEVCIPALMTLLSRYGIALEPHPQNMVLILRDGWPHRFAVRDFGGARILPARLAQHGYSIELDANTGLVIEESDILEGAARLRAKIFYPLFGNQYGELVSALCELGGTDEARLWGVLRDVVRRTALSIGNQEALQDSRALLEGDWQRKCLLRMRLENAVTDQLYVNAPNPLKRVPILAAKLSLNQTEQIMFDHLRIADPELCLLWQEELPGARESIQADFCTGLEREGVIESASDIQGISPDWRQLMTELEDSATNLALSRILVRQRGQQLCKQAAGRDLLTTLAQFYCPSDIPIELDSLDAEGHPSHPGRKTRLGFSPQDSLSFSPEAGNTVHTNIFAVRCDRIVLSQPTFSETLREHYPFIIDAASDALRRRGLDASKFELLAAHAFQASQVVPRIYKNELASGIIVPLPEVSLAFRPTSSTRTLVGVTPGVKGKRLAIKTAIDVQITSTRRTISHESVRNGPYISALLARLVSCEPRAACILELASAAVIVDDDSSIRQRGLSAIVREDVVDYAGPNDLIIGCAALTTASPISGEPLVIELVNNLAKGGKTECEMTTEIFLDAYADLLLSAVLPLLWRHGIAIEAHLQNTLLVLDSHHTPVKILLRDFAGIRVHLDRLRESGEDTNNIPCPHAMTFTNDEEKIYAKLAHSVIFTNLMPVVNALSAIVSTERLWALIRTRVEKIHTRFTAESDSKAIKFADEHLARLLSRPTLPQKALVTMRLLSKGSGGSDFYTMQANPLYTAQS
ncbi:hypothetical protein ABW20_dc0108293 [Dactylellina cionopaga]|nr:hypothetical protein ABW20_dc0108293 [Dactylellina cionopaga]